MVKIHMWLWTKESLINPVHKNKNPIKWIYSN